MNESANSVAPPSRIVRFTDRAILAWLFVFALAAPHSIAATQIAWSLGLALTIVRFLLKPRPQLRRSAVDLPLLAFIALSFLAALTSYARDISIGKLPSVLLFTILYLVTINVTSRRVARLLGVAMIASCMANVVFTLGERVAGRGIKLDGIAQSSPLFAAGIRDADTLLEANGRSLGNPSDLASALESSGPGGVVRVHVYRFEAHLYLDVHGAASRTGGDALTGLGATAWSRGRDWRAAGFFGHYTTYAESLQLIASLVFGLLVACGFGRRRVALLLAVCLIGMVAALQLTVTRASVAAFLVSAAVIVLSGASRKAMLILALCALPFAISGLYVLQQKRNVRFLDSADSSIAWRQTVYRDAVRVTLSSPRNILVGAGMDSVKRFACEWQMFDSCRLPIGHMHSNILQFAFERGIPALLCWLAFMGAYAVMLWRRVRSAVIANWVERGLMLGALGGIAGFFASGLVHYNFGDSEVVMIFYFIAGIVIRLGREQ